MESLLEFNILLMKPLLEFSILLMEAPTDQGLLLRGPGIEGMIQVIPGH